MSPEILLVLMIVCCAGFVVVTYFKTQQDFGKVAAQIETTKTANEENVARISKELNSRYLQLLKLAEDLAMQQGRLVSLERTIAMEKDSVGQLQDTLTQSVAALKKDGGERSAEVAILQEKFKDAIQSKEKTIAQLQGEYESLKNVMDDQSALLVMIREQAIINSANGSGQPSSSLPSSPLATPIEITAQTPPPPGTQTPQSYQANSITPIPSTEAPQPTTPQPTPVPVNNAETIPGRESAAPAPSAQH